MRVLHLDAGKEMRGGQWQVLRLLEGLARGGVESTLLARPQCPLFEKARQAGVRIEPLGLARFLALALRHDLVHAHDARSHTVAALLPGPPLIVARRVGFPVGSRWKYARPRRYIAVSDYVKSVLIAGGIPEPKIAVVPDGVPLLPPAQGSAVLAPDNAGDPQKGARLAAAAARLVDVPLRSSNNLEADLATAGIFLYITHSEGLGSAVLLAMSAALPVIASKTGGLCEVVRHGENGLLVENSPEAIAAALRALLQNPGLARRLGEAARCTIAARFTVDIMARRTREVYDEVLA
jgi:hypothetical protein